MVSDNKEIRKFYKNKMEMETEQNNQEEFIQDSIMDLSESCSEIYSIIYDLEHYENSIEEIKGKIRNLRVWVKILSEDISKFEDKLK